MAKGRKTTQYESIDQIDLQNDLFEVVDHSETVIAKKNKKGTFSQVAEALGTVLSGSVTSFQNIGEGEGEVYSHTSGSVGLLRTLKAGENVEIETNGNEIIITNMGGIPSGSIIPTGSIITLRNFKLNENMETEDLAVLMTNGSIRKVEYSWFGNEYVFNPDTTTNIATDTLDIDKFIVCYIDTTTGYGITRIGVIDEGVIEYGIPYIFNSSTTSNVRVKKLTVNKVVITYNGNAVIGTINETNITFGTSYPYAPVPSNLAGLVSLDSTRFIIAGRATASGSARVGTVTDSTISYGNSYSFTTVSTSNHYGLSIDKLNSDKIALYHGYSDGIARNFVYIGDVSGSVISFGSADGFSPSPQSTNLNIIGIDSSSFVLHYYSDTDSANLVRFASVSGTSVTYQNAITLNSTNPSSVSSNLCFIDTTTFIAFYNTSPGVGRRKIGTISGTSISFGDAVTFNGGYSNFISSKLLGDGIFIVCYTDNDNLFYGTAIFGAGTLSSLTQDKVLGILQEGGSSGSLKPVTTFGEVSTVHSGLTPGDLYYYNILTKKGVTLSNTRHLAGPAYSSTDLKIVTY